LDRLLADADEPPSISAPASPPRPRSALEERMDATVSALERALAAEPDGGSASAWRTEGPNGADQGGARGRDAEREDGPEDATDSDASSGPPGDEQARAEPVPLTDLPPQRLAAALAERLWAEAPTAE